MSELPILNRDLVCSAAFQAREDVRVPAPELLDLPEKVVQFGTGAFLRGFVDCFIDEANRQGRFGGRIVAVGSTGSGRDRVLNEQDGLYTLCVEGLEEGRPRSERRIVASVSRALSAASAWDEVLACARNPHLELVFSNTTEVGIVLDPEDDGALQPPRSFPGKLTRFLYERARAFDFDPAYGVVVIPCELIEDNGDRLRRIVLELGERWGLGAAFGRWIEEGVPFCNTLVDRIVPGTPGEARLGELQETLGYRDGLLTTCEVYRLFAIQGDEALRRRLAFVDADPGIVIAEDITPYRERKVRLLNGTHTITVPAALLCGCETVVEAVGHPLVGRFVRRVLFEELVPSLDVEGAEAFAREVLDRFSNPFIRHELIDITLQATTKMRVRVVPSILRYAVKTGRPPAAVAFGFAAYLLFMRGDLQEERRRAGLHVPPDDRAEHFRSLWCSAGDDEAGLERLARAVCSDASLWDVDLSAVPGFVRAVADHLTRACRGGVPAALEAFLDG